MTNAWTQGMRCAAVRAVALALGMQASPDGEALGWISPCPACGCEHSATTRVGLVRQGRGWRCHSCDEGGGTRVLVELVIGGGLMHSLTRDKQAAVRAWCKTWLRSQKPPLKGET